LDGSGYDTDKGQNYLGYYEAFFAPHRHRAMRLLELGVHRGGSLLMWRDYFATGEIFGVDLAPPPMERLDRLHVIAGDATDPETFASIERATGAVHYDIIIDDASHVGTLTKRSFEYLFKNRLAPGGLYVIEDWGTGYLANWPDGESLDSHIDVPAGPDPRVRFRSHDLGIPGFVKQLIDHVAQNDVRAGGARFEAYEIDYVTVAPGLVFIKKSG
jgi:hypothetical protein